MRACPEEPRVLRRAFFSFFFAGAYRALALTATVAGRWDDAAGHWKNALFLATSDDSEYLQRLGALLVRSGLRALARMGC